MVFEFMILQESISIVSVAKLSLTTYKINNQFYPNISSEILTSQLLDHLPLFTFVGYLRSNT